MHVLNLLLSCFNEKGSSFSYAKNICLKHKNLKSYDFGKIYQNFVMPCGIAAQHFTMPPGKKMKQTGPIRTLKIKKGIDQLLAGVFTLV